MKILLLAIFSLLIASCTNSSAVSSSSSSSSQSSYQSKFVPPDGKVLVIAGQDKLQISQLVPAWGITPAGFACYFAVSSSNGIWSDFNNTGDPYGLQNAKWIADSYSNTVLQMAMWMVGKSVYGVDYCSNTINHQYDQFLDSFCLFAKTVKVPIYLRIGYEFDGTHNKLEPVPYVACYRYIVDYTRNKGVSNIAFVWHSYASPPYNGYSIADWYPGDEYVDWAAVSVFRWQIQGGYYSPYLTDFVSYAKSKNKPVMFAESCPSDKGITNAAADWDGWFVPYFNFIKSNNIKAFSYINCNWDIVQQFTNQGWGNTRLQDFPTLLTKWTNELADSRYLIQSTNLFEILGYHP